ncbi:MAG: peptide-binding protein [Planctomycetota bacterium]|jgi:peptide/nickel transport system substrate-binding protein
MNNRGGVVTFFLFLLILIVLVLQILSMIQSDRLYERLNRLEGSLGSDIRTDNNAKSKRVSVTDEQYPGDEGDWLVFRLGAEPATLNPITSKDLYASWVTGGSIFESLLEYDLDKVELKPLLAEWYEVSADGLEITFHLRDDIHFSDGVSVTVDDVLFTYETIMNPGVDAANLASYYQNIKRVIKINVLTVKFIMAEPYFKSVAMIGGMPIIPKHIYKFSDPEEFNGQRFTLVGTGPYLFEKWDVGREVVLTRNESYWGPKPKLKKIIFPVITNSLAAIQALRSGDVDYMRPDPEQFADLSKDEDFGKNFRSLMYWNPGAGYRFIGWNVDTPFFKDKRVRLAMTHIINRQEFLTHIVKGFGKLITGPFYVFGPQNDPNIKPWPYDPEKAKQLLDEAGWVDTDGDGIRDKDGIPFRFNFMYVSKFPLHEQLAKLLRDEAAKVGISVVPDPYEWSVFNERLNNREFESVTLGWTGSIQEDPYQIWHSSQIAGRGSNHIGFSNPEVDAIIEEARRTFDDAERIKLYRRFHRILHEEQPYTFLLCRPSLRFLDKRFENVIVHKLGIDPAEWYVPKEEQRYK